MQTVTDRKIQTKAPDALYPLRFVTAASLFDGHDAAINIMRRVLQSAGVEVIHLGHNRAAEEIVMAAIEEDANGIAISSYQGGHVEFFRYIIDLLQQHHAGHIKVFGGGGGVITSEEIQLLEDYGVERIYSPEDGQKLGLKGMIQDVIQRTRQALKFPAYKQIPQLNGVNALAQFITALEQGRVAQENLQQLHRQANVAIPVLGITGTGGAGKSSLTDELLSRFQADNPQVKIAIIALDPTKRKTGGALLGDRIRMNAINTKNIFLRSLATRDAKQEIVAYLDDVIAACRSSDFQLIIVETPGIGQGDAGIVPHVDLSLYVMTPEFGAASQLEKIDMLDYADCVAINKFDRKGAEDALRDVRKQLQRNQELFTTALEEMPVYGTIASQFNDQGITALYHYLLQLFNENNKGKWQSKLPLPKAKLTDINAKIIPVDRQNYLLDIVKTVNHYHDTTQQQAQLAHELQALQTTKQLLNSTAEPLITKIAHLTAALTADNQQLLASWPELQQLYRQQNYRYQVRDKTIEVPLFTETLSGTKIPKISLPRYRDQGDQLNWLREENVPGQFPYTSGVFPFKRQGEDPGRMFAGEGDAKRTNKRFKVLSKDSTAKRLSTAFDSVTLYGFDPDERPDIYGKVGNSGVSIATLDDMQELFAGFDLCDGKTSVSMTINGPAPTILAMFLNAAINQQIEKFQQEKKSKPTTAELETIKQQALHVVRGTVQADILKEDQGQNTCIFSTEFSLKMMADVQQYFIENKVKNFYSVSISGYHIAEAGANPISQLAFTLSNAFTYVEAYLARGMHIDDFAPNLSFFFSNSMDAEYSVLGRVARKIWAIAMRDLYGANERSQKLKYHIQTSGRSLHAQEMAFNDIRTTLEALIAIYDNCNSLHTNAYDEAITTPTEESVRRAMAIQLIINQEWGLAKNENPLQGSFIIEELTDLVEQAVLTEFERINQRGGVLGAMETGYQRGRIQDESMLYEMRKHDGSLPLVGVNTFINKNTEETAEVRELARSTEAEKQSQLTRLRAFHARHAEQAPAMLEQIKQTARKGENVFAVLMQAVQVCSLGQITQALFEVGGQYRRNV
ncbi:MAG: fused isobutyryl-CoA mutase/GTPase IcmF [Pseudomonadota bacterium]